MIRVNASNERSIGSFFYAKKLMGVMFNAREVSYIAPSAYNGQDALLV